MKSFIKKFVAVVTVIAGVFGMSATQAFAATSLNNHPSDFATVRVSNYTASPGSSGTWLSSVNAAADQIVSVGIYYHNNGSENATNMRIKFTSPQTSPSSASHTVSAQVYADNASSVSGSATVNVIGGSQSLAFIPTGVYWYPNQGSTIQTLPAGQNGSELFTSNGLNLGTITPGWSSQGSLVVQFRVSNTGGSGQAPTATTQSASANETSATLNGTYDMNGVAGNTWFEWGTSPSNLNNNTPTQSQTAGSFGSMSATASGLDDNTTYYFRACAEQNSGTYAGQDFCGSTLNFTTDDAGGNGGSNVQVTTVSADDVDESSAELVGDLTNVGSGSVTRWFEWDTNSSDVSNGDGNTLSVSGTTSSTGQFTRTLSGLNDGTTYYFRACAEDNSNDDDCGSVRSFTTDDNNGGPVDGDEPDVTTLSAYGIGSSVATMNGYYDANGSSTDVWFEWGRTSSLGNSTAHQGKGNTQGNMTYQFTGLSANTTYFYRAVASNDEGTDRGSIMSFKTTSTGGVTPIVDGTFLRLQIENGEEQVSRGDELDYEVIWENISGRDLENVIIKIDMPRQVVITDATDGKIDKKDNMVVLNLGDLDKGDEGNMTISVRVKGGDDEDAVIAQATAAFDHPTIEDTTQVNAVAYDSDEYDANGSAFGASLFGLFDGNIAGLLLIILLVVLIILIARKQFMDSKDRKATRGNAIAAPIAQDGMEANNGGYRPYRPTPVQ